MKKFRLRMVTPERSFYDREVLSVTVKDAEGERQILADHEPFVVSLPAATVRIDDGEQTLVCSNSEGFLAVKKDGVYILCQTFEWPDEIEVDRVNRAIEEHTEELEKTREEHQRLFHTMTLERAYARLSLLALMREKNKRK